MKMDEIKGILGDHVASGKPYLKMISCGEIMISGLPYSFSLQNIGAASNKGLCVTISGDDVDSGRVRFTDLYYLKNVDGKIVPQRTDFFLVPKKDGKKLYQARFTDMKLEEFSTGSAFENTTEEEFIQAVNSQISFKVTPLFDGDDMPEVMPSIYPFADPITGSATEWKKVTSDQDYFLHNLKKGRRKMFGNRR